MSSSQVLLQTQLSFQGLGSKPVGSVRDVQEQQQGHSFYLPPRRRPGTGDIVMPSVRPGVQMRYRGLDSFFKHTIIFELVTE